MTRSFADARESFKSFGANLTTQAATDWTGPFELPAVVASMYSELGPDDIEVPAYGNDLLFPSLAQLWDFQAGYRYHGLTGEPLSDWPDDLLVVANQGGDPIAIDRSLGTVQVALHGTGQWRFEHLSDSLIDVMVSIGVMGSIVNDAAPDLCDEDSLVLQIHVQRAITGLTDLVGEELAHRLILWAEWKS